MRTCNLIPASPTKQTLVQNQLIPTLNQTKTTPEVEIFQAGVETVLESVSDSVDVNTRNCVVTSSSLVMVR